MYIKDLVSFCLFHFPVTYNLYLHPNSSVYWFIRITAPYARLFIGPIETLQYFEIVILDKALTALLKSLLYYENSLGMWCVNLKMVLKSFAILVRSQRDWIVNESSGLSSPSPPPPSTLSYCTTEHVYWWFMIKEHESYNGEDYCWRSNQGEFLIVSWIGLWILDKFLQQLL